MRGDDVSDDGSELINDLHDATSFNIDDPYLTAELAPGSSWNQGCVDHLGHGILARPAFSGWSQCTGTTIPSAAFSSMDRATVKVIGEKLREQLPPPDTKSSKELRRLLVKLERREREQNRKPH